MNFFHFNHEKTFRSLNQSFEFRDKKAKTVLYILSSFWKKDFQSYLTQENIDFKKILEAVTDNNKKTMIRLAESLYYDQPFRLGTLEELDKEDYKIAIEAIRYRYQKTVLYETEPFGYSIIREEEPAPYYYGLTDFSKSVEKEGIPCDTRKLSTYRARGHLPEPTVYIGKNPGWTEYQVKEWVEDYKAGKIVHRRNKNERCK